MDSTSINKSSYYSKVPKIIVMLFMFMLIGRFTSFYWLLPKIIDSSAFALLSAGATFLVVVDLFTEKRFSKAQNILWLALFLGSCLVSCILHIKYGWSDNFKAFFSIIISLFFLYTYANVYGEKSFVKTIVFLQKVLVVSWLILAIMSIFMFFVQYSTIFYMYGTRILFGCIEGRLFGVFSDPNYASIVSILTIIFSAFLLMNENKKSKMRILYTTNIIVQTIYIALGMSRTAEVCLLLMAFLVSFAISYKSRSHKSKVTTLIISILCAFALCAVVHFALEYIRLVFSYVPSLFKQFKVNSSGGSFVFYQVSMERPDVVESNDISNLRFRIWSSAIDIFKTTWLFGASPRNALIYAKDVIPDAFIVKRGYDAHNFYVATILYTGVCGVITLGTFLVSAAIKIVKYYINNRFDVKNRMLNVAVLSVICIALGGVFLSDILFITTVESFLFWLFLGFILNYIADKTSGAEKIYEN